MTKFILTGRVALADGIRSHAAAQQARSKRAVFVAMYERGPAWLEGKEVPEQSEFSEHVQ